MDEIKNDLPEINWASKYLERVKNDITNMQEKIITQDSKIEFLETHLDEAEKQLEENANQRIETLIRHAYSILFGALIGFIAIIISIGSFIYMVILNMKNH